MAAACPADGTPMLAAGEDLLLGQMVGVYRIARLLGIGGMGRVYKGVHPTIGSRVAIKVLSRECSDRRDLVDRFFAEAKTVNFIRHESIVNVLDLATLPDGRPYIVMEYLDGGPLSSIIEGAQRAGVMLPLGGVARLVAEVLDALAAAHAKGIVHRDLKPDNVFVTPAGRAKVLDFGIAKLQPELGGSATHTGSLLGTPHYMSPEQASGRPVDARADIYAVGVILFECATLQKPFTADSLFDLLRKHVEAPPPSPRALRRDMPEGMEHVIMAALAKLPEQRFASAHAMSMALQHATSQLPPAAWEPVRPQRAGSGGWSPTPPASWARREAGPTQREQFSGPTVNATPTPSVAGQVSAPAKRSSKGLWLALGAIALVGGGVTAGVLLSSGRSSTAAGAGSSEPGAVVVKSGSADPAKPEPTEPRPDPKTEPAKDDDGDVDEPTAAALDGMLEGQLDGLPPEALAALPPELRAAIKKYGGWSKVPKAEHARILKQVGKMVGSFDVTTGDAINNALAGGSTPAPPPPPPPKTDGWFERHSIRPPGFDPKHANIEKFIAFAYDEAKKYVPDAEAWWIDADGVFPDGHADLTLPAFASDTGSITVRFISPSRAKPDPTAPRGIPQKTKCAFYITIGPEGGEMYETGTDCKEKLVKRPRCTAAQVWKKVLALHPDGKNAVANIVYRDWNGKGAWDLDVRDDEHPISERVPDDC
jgi:serine/threonine-protein kinase